MIASTSRHFVPGRAGTRRSNHPLRLALAMTALASLALGIGAPVQATSVSPTVSVNGVGYNGATLTTGGIYTVQVNLNPHESADFGKTTANKVHSCDRQHVSSPEYCVTDIRSHLVGAPVISGLTLDGYDLSEEATVSGDTLSFLDGSYIPGTHLINFTETFAEARTQSKYFYGNKNPNGDGYTIDADPNAILIPKDFSGSLLSCGFTGSVSIGSLFNTVATCSLRLTYAFPDMPPPPPPPSCLLSPAFPNPWPGR